MNAIQLRNDYQSLTKGSSIVPKISENDFVKLFLNKELERINKALKTWTDKSKTLYKSKYKRILKEKQNLLIEIESLG